ncbi:MAG: hypothetical protein Alis3KO_38850 [Aliiglaciecola sp.]
MLMIKRLVGLCLLMMSSVVCHAQSLAVNPAEVYRNAGQLSSMLNAIAQEMGIEAVDREPIAATRVSPREVYFQAATLYGKTSRLMFEFTSDEGDSISILRPDAKPEDVQNLLKQSEKHLHSVLKELNIQSNFPLPPYDDGKSPTDVFRLIVTLNRITNRLLDFKFSPAESHQKITEAIGVAAAILETYKDTNSVFAADDLQRGKTPRDVYHRLAKLYKQLTPIMTKMNSRCLILGDYEEKRRDVEPSDVFDLAVLMAGQLRYLHSKLPTAKAPIQAYYPGKVIPSQVYQRLSILHQQIDELSNVHGLDLVAGN